MPGRPLPRWPLLLIAAPAAVAIWSGWVGLGGMAGFGVVRPLPGIASAIQINTAITLPIGVEAYGAFALGAWLLPGTGPQARQFARWSAIGALALGCLGQITYHLLAAAHVTVAPWPIVIAVSCLPIVTLGFGMALVHLLRADDTTPETAPEALPVAVPVATPPPPAPVLPSPFPVAAVAAAETTPQRQQVRQPVRQKPRQTAAKPAANWRDKAARLVAADPAITAQDLAGKCGVSKRSAERYKETAVRPHLVKEEAHA